ncbi:MAG TPA: hypothetical protein VFF04_00090 [Candidatus Babeliales bacterium]|nr:hypothetical protein [Candidatus Babeliales bacterium]
MNTQKVLIKVIIGLSMVTPAVAWPEISIAPETMKQINGSIGALTESSNAMAKNLSGDIKTIMKDLGTDIKSAVTSLNGTVSTSTTTITNHTTTLLKNLPIIGFGFAGGLYALSMIRQGFENLISTDETEQLRFISLLKRMDKKEAARIVAGIMLLIANLHVIGNSERVVAHFSAR